MKQETCESCEVPKPVEAREGRKALWLALGAGALASACCVGPFLLVLLGVGLGAAAWLAKLEPFQPYFATLALAALGVAAWRRRRCGCKLGAGWWAAAVATLLLVTAPWWLAKVLS